MPFLRGKILGGGGGRFSHPVHRIPFMWRSEDTSQELALSSHQSPRDQTQVVGFGGKQNPSFML